MAFLSKFNDGTSYNPIPESIRSQIVNDFNEDTRFYKDQSNIENEEDIVIKKNNKDIIKLKEKPITNQYSEDKEIKLNYKKLIKDMNVKDNSEEFHSDTTLPKVKPENQIQLIQPNDDNESDLRRKDKYKYKLPDKLKRTCWCVSILFVLGFGLLITGLIQSIQNQSFKSGVTFYILSLILIIPGGFYTCQFMKARCSKDVDKREEILNEIPQL